MRKFCISMVGVCALLLPGAAAADPYADSVVNYSPGVSGGFNSAFLPGIALGSPKGGGPFQGSFDIVSLGVNGSITLEFTDNKIVDGPGVDLTVFENPFLVGNTTQTSPPFAEPGTVAVSSDGVNFHSYPCSIGEPPYYPGCAGVYPVFANANNPAAPPGNVPTTVPIQNLVGSHPGGFVQPPGSGGDSFDLAAVGLSSARFVRVTSGNIVNWGGTNAGFDFDAVAAVNSAPPGSDPPDPDPEIESVPLYGSSLSASTGSKTHALTVKAQNKGSEPGYSDQSDPTLDGATLRVSGGDVDQSYELPAGSWKAKVKKDKVTKLKLKTGEFSYKSSKTAPTAIASLSLAKGKLSISGKGLGLGLDLDPNPAPLTVSLEIGDRVRCASFGGETKLVVAGSGTRKLTAKKAAAPVDCEV